MKASSLSMGLAEPRPNRNGNNSQPIKRCSIDTCLSIVMVSYSRDGEVSHEGSLLQACGIGSILTHLDLQDYAQSRGHILLYGVQNSILVRWQKCPLDPFSNCTSDALPPADPHTIFQNSRL
jgi:hypothetical protein